MGDLTSCELPPHLIARLTLLSVHELKCQSALKRNKIASLFDLLLGRLNDGGHQTPRALHNWTVQPTHNFTQIFVVGGWPLSDGLAYAELHLAQKTPRLGVRGTLQGSLLTYKALAMFCAWNCVLWLGRVKYCCCFHTGPKL